MSKKPKPKAEREFHTLLSVRAIPGLRVCLYCEKTLRKGERNGPCPKGAKIK